MTVSYPHYKLPSPCYITRPSSKNTLLRANNNVNIRKIHMSHNVDQCENTGIYINVPLHVTSLKNITTQSSTT